MHQCGKNKNICSQKTSQRILSLNSFGTKNKPGLMLGKVSGYSAFGNFRWPEISTWAIHLTFNFLEVTAKME